MQLGFATKQPEPPTPSTIPHLVKATLCKQQYREQRTITVLLLLSVSETIIPGPRILNE